VAVLGSRGKGLRLGCRHFFHVSWRLFLLDGRQIHSNRERGRKKIILANASAADLTPRELRLQCCMRTHIRIPGEIIKSNEARGGMGELR